MLAHKVTGIQWPGFMRTSVKLVLANRRGTKHRLLGIIRDQLSFSKVIVRSPLSGRVVCETSFGKTVRGTAENNPTATIILK